LVWELYHCWAFRGWSLWRCALWLSPSRDSRDLLRFRWAEVDEEFALWRERKLEKLRTRAAERRWLRSSLM
jgi:hypothetical protein